MESRDLRIIVAAQQIFGAKILRLASLAQDDKRGRLPDKLQLWLSALVSKPQNIVIGQ